MKDLTLKGLWIRKARNYFDQSRDDKGVPAKTMEQCFTEVQEDYPPVNTFNKQNDLDEFNKWHKAHWNRITRTPKQVEWANNTADDTRTCQMCLRRCSNPVLYGPSDGYKTIIKKTGREEEEFNELR